MNARHATVIRDAILTARATPLARWAHGRKSRLWRRAHQRTLIGVHGKDIRFFSTHGVAMRLTVPSPEFDLGYVPRQGQIVWVVSERADRLGDGITPLRDLPSLGN